MCHQHKTLYSACGCVHNISPQPDRCDEYRRGRCRSINREPVSEHSERVCKQCVVALRATIRRLFQQIENDMLRMANETHRRQAGEARERESAIVW